MKTSVVILNWNGAALLRQFLPSVVAHTPSALAEVVVADNGSTDESLAVLRSEFPTVRIIAMPDNAGFAGGYNRALEQITTEYAVLLNSDVEVTPGWLEPLVAYAESHPDAAALQPKIRAYRCRDRFEHAGAAGGFIDRYGYPFCRGRIFDTVERDEGQYDTAIDIFWATGACLFVRMADYRLAGGLDERFFAHMEEIDLCWRLHRLGRRIACLPESTVFHLGGATLDVNNPRKAYLNFRNNLLMLYKNLPDGQRSSLIFRRKLLDGLAALNFLLHGNVQGVRAIVRAHRDASRMIREHYAHAPQRSDMSHAFPCTPISIVWAYYVKGIKRFSQL
jgi:hypothetical protein